MSRDRADAGFTLVELLVALVLLGIVLAAIYGATNAMLLASRQSEAQSIFARESGEPMRYMEKALMQNTKLTNTATDTITLLTDRNLDALSEEVVITAGPDMRLSYKEYQLNSLGARTAVRMDWPNMAEHCDNVARGVPLFVYWVKEDGMADTDGSTVYDRLPDDDVPSQGVNARKVTVQLCLTANGQLYTTSQDVFFRNRDY